MGGKKEKKSLVCQHELSLCSDLPELWGQRSRRSNRAEQTDCERTEVCVCVCVCCRRSYVDDGVFEFDVKSVVGDGDDGIVRSAQKLHTLAL